MATNPSSSTHNPATHSISQSRTQADRSQRRSRIQPLPQAPEQQSSNEQDPVPDVVMTDSVKYDRDAHGKRQINQYLFQQKLGRGQHGEVFVAIDTTKDFEVAIKAVKRRNAKAEKMNLLRKRNLPQSPHLPVSQAMSTTEHKLRKEIAIMKKCRHPHVVRLLEVIDDQIRDSIYLVMEYLEGGEIKWRNLAEEPILRVDQTRRICRDVILGLEYLHHQGIIHRDIKPANLLWTADRRMVKIADFGVSHFSYAQRLSAAGEDDTDSVTDPHLMDDSDLSKFAGTPMFLAPEIISDTSTAESSTSSNLNQLGTSSTSTVGRKKAPITKAIDIWAFGVTLYGLLFGTLPFRAENEYHIYNVIRTGDWDVPDIMGLDRLPVGGRRQKKPSKGQQTEGYLVVKLLEGILEKDVKKRLTLDQVKRHPWILKDMPDPDSWLRKTQVSTTSLAATEAETTSAISSVRFRWTATRIAKGLTSFLRNVRRQPSFPRRGTIRARRSEDDYKDVGTRSAPNVHLTRHRSSGAVLSRERDHRTKHVLLGPNPSRRSLQPLRVEPPRNKSTADVAGSVGRAQGQPSTSPQKYPFEPFNMWNSSSSPALSGSGRKARRGSESDNGRRGLNSLQVPPRSSRVASPQPSSASGSPTGYNIIASPIATESSPQMTPVEERPRSRLSTIVQAIWPRSKASYGPSPQEASTSAISSSPPSHTPQHLQSRSSEDAFYSNITSRKSSGSEPLNIGMRAASWGEVGDYMRPSEDVRSILSVDRMEDALDQETLLLGAGGVAQSPVPSLPSGVLSTVSSAASLGPPALSPAHIILHRHDGSETPVSDPSTQNHSSLQRLNQYRSPGQSSSPLALPSISRELSERSSVYSSSVESSDDHTPSESDYELQPSTSQMYQLEDESDDEDEIPLEVRTRRPSVTVTEAEPPQLPRRTDSRRSERTMICT